MNERLVTQMRIKMLFCSGGAAVRPTMSDFCRRIRRSGRKSNLPGSVGYLAYQQRDFEEALRYIIQSLVLFDALHSLSHALILKMIFEIRNHMDDARFTRIWRELAFQCSLPAL
jgi:hypothetical protein